MFLAGNLVRLQAARLAPTCVAQMTESYEAAYQNKITTGAAKSLAVTAKLTEKTRCNVRRARRLRYALRIRLKWRRSLTVIGSKPDTRGDRGKARPPRSLYEYMHR
jgi:hypothetical protein